MITEESKAHNYRCPQTVATETHDSSCRGSTCMAWRWAAEANPDYEHILMMPPDPRTNLMYIRSKTHGYCGLAGQA
jgi:hypothetical protein